MKTQIILLSVAAVLAGTPKIQGNFERTETKTGFKKTLDFDFIFFRTHQQCKSVISWWELNNTNGVMSFTIQRTYGDPRNDNTIWEDLESSLPIAGAPSKYVDRNPDAGNISYRVIAWLFDGSAVVSDISREHICSRHCRHH